MLSKQVSEICMYDKNGYITKRFIQPENPVGACYTFKYDLKGDLIECDFYRNPKELINVTKFTYNDSREVVEEKNYFYGKLTMHSNYSYLEFDSENNWTKRKASYESPWDPGAKNTETIIRKITYY